MGFVSLVRKRLYEHFLCWRAYHRSAGLGGCRGPTATTNFTSKVFEMRRFVASVHFMVNFL